MRDIGKKVGLLPAFAAVCAMSLPSVADVKYSLDGGTLTVNVPSSLAGKGLVLLWDAEDKGTTASAWANSTNIVDTVPAVGGREEGKVRNAETELTGKNRIIYVQQPKKGRKP